MRRIPKRLAVPAALLAFAFAGAGVAYALTSSDFAPRAAKWQSASCTASLLATRESLGTNQKIALCFALDKLQEDDAKITGLESTVAALQEQRTPADFTFFSGVPNSTYSPAFDAHGYSKVTITCGPYTLNGSGGLSLEASSDGSHWLAQVLPQSWPVSHFATFPTVARYYRMSTESLGSTYFPEGLEVTAQFSN